MFANDKPLGVLGAFSNRPAAFNQQQLTLLRALADHAAAAISNRQLLVQLRESERELREQAAELERTLTAHRALDEIARLIVDADPAEVLQQVVDMASGLLGSDGAHLTLMSEEHDALIPMVMAGHTDPDIRAWLHSRRFPIGGGINGLAALTREAVWTESYIDDDRWPHEPDDDSPEKLELGAVIVAPLLGPGAEALGTLAITYREPRPIDPRDVILLEELARQASIAARNSSLYAELRDRTEALQTSESRYRNLVDHSPDLVWEVDAEGRFTYIGETLERLTGFRPEQVLGRTWMSLLTPESVEIAQRNWNAIEARPDDEQQFRVQTPLAGGGEMTAEINMIGTIAEGRFAGAHGSLRDITERERLQEDLRHRSAELAANQERASLARELHDSVTQALFSMGLTLRTIELLFDRDPAAARAKFGELRELQNDALAEMRTLIFELRPRGLETDGLEQALRNHAAAVSGRTGLTVQVETALAGRLPLDTEEALYRIAQEALHNVVKHANAKTAEIRLLLKQDVVELAVEDDGAGFDPALVSGTKLGLIAMRQRAERLGGTVEIQSKPGDGTRVLVSMPAAVTAEMASEQTSAPAESEPVVSA
jgi:PAS domain S-box-containing protein